MDANGLRFWMLSSGDDWSLSAGAAYCADRKRLHLRSTPDSPPNTESYDQARPLVDAVPFALDQFGTYARFASGHVMAAAPGVPETPIYTPPAGKTVTDLALGYDGVLYVAVSGQLVFVDRRDRWPTFTLPDSGANFNVWRLAAHPDGGVVALDRERRQLLRVEGLPLADAPPLPYAADVMRPCDDNADPPRVSATLPLPLPMAPIAIAGDGSGRFAVLSWNRDAADNDAVYLHTFSAMTTFDGSFTLDTLRFPYTVAWLEADRVAVIASQNKKAFAFELDGTDLQPSGDSYVLADFNPGPFAHGFSQPPHYNLGQEIFPLLPLSLNSLAREGRATNARTLDSGITRAVWHRLFLEASLPPRCGVVVWVAASDDRDALADPNTPWYPHLFGDAAPAGASSDAPRGVWQRTPSEVPLHPGLLGVASEPNHTGLFMTLVQRSGLAVRSLRGRFLGVRIDLAGDGRTTPEVAALRAYASRFSYVERYLPELYHETAFGPDADVPGPSTRADFFERFVDIFEAPMTQFEDRIAASYLLTDPSSAPDAGLDWLGSWIGVEPDPVPSGRHRAQLRAAPRLYRERGTVQGVVDAIDVATNGLCRRGAVLVVEDYRLRHTFATILGADLSITDDPLLPGAWQSANSFVGDTLFLGDEHHKEFLSLFADAIRTAKEQAQVDAFFDQLAHRMTVFVHDQVELVDLQLVRRIVDREKPAHVAVTYLRASQPFLIGMASLLGVNTYLTPEPAKEIATVDRSAIGRHAFIAQLPSLYPGLDRSAPPVAPGDPIARVDGPRVIAGGASFTLDASGSTPPPDHRLTAYRWTIVTQPS